MSDAQMNVVTKEQIETWLRGEPGILEVKSQMEKNAASICRTALDALATERASKPVTWPDGVREGLASAAVEAEEATRLLVFLLELFAPKLTEAEIYQLRRAKDFVECARAILKEIGE